MKGNFLSLQFASDTQGTGFLNQPGHFKLSGNIPQNCHAQLQHSYRTLLDEIIPPTSSAEKSFTCFCFQLIMVYHWFIILIPLLSVFHLSCGPKSNTSFPPLAVNLLFRTPTATEGVANDGWVKRFMSSSGGCLRLTSVACRLGGGGSHGDDE